MHDFLEQHGWTHCSAIAEDGSARKYSRISKNGQRAVLMDASADHIEKLSKFTQISQWLRDIGLSAPEIYEADMQRGFLLMEDFGDLSFKVALDEGMHSKMLYDLAQEVLEHLAQLSPPPLPEYFKSYVHEARDLIMRWYWPALRGEEVPEDVIQEYLSAWDDVQGALPPPDTGFLHIDFHPGNLMLLPGREGVKRCGILDFQDAMIGPRAYDLVNLLEDMRRDVPPDVRDAALVGRDESFLAWYRVLGMQFHCRLIGQCVRWAVRDGKLGYLEYMPRLFGYVEEALGDEVLQPLKRFFDGQDLDFRSVPDMNMDFVHKTIHKNAS